MVRDRRGVVYQKEQDGSIRRIGRIVLVGSEGQEPQKRIVPDSNDQLPANKKERRKMRQGLPYRTKGGEQA
jgi:hypothetical protein